jgi:pantoate--beta-alanine ligase
METIRISSVMQETSNTNILKGRKIGFVPTMGALHEGHLSLVRRSKQENDITVVSIFVNPIQFGPNEDFNRYPRDFDGDFNKLQSEGVDILFYPDIASIYPEGYSTYVEVKGLSDKLCGAFRPGHFKGVATIVTKLFNIVKPKRAYFGQKDYQQSVIIRRMVKDLNLDVEIIVCPTVREEDGLAMSSRNSYLSGKEREAATIIYKTLTKASELIQSGIIDGVRIKNFMMEEIKKEPAVSSIDYVGVYDPETLDEIDIIKSEVVLAAAIFIGKTRLIDNIIV